jgi:hypothetical protein
MPANRIVKAVRDQQTLLGPRAADNHCSHQSQELPDAWAHGAGEAREAKYRRAS